MLSMSSSLTYPQYYCEVRKIYHKSPLQQCVSYCDTWHGGILTIDALQNKVGVNFGD